MECFLGKSFIAISNHGAMLGGGEYSFVDLLSHLPVNWEPLAVVPEKGNMWPRLVDRNIPVTVIPLPAIRPRHTPSTTSSLKTS